MVPNLTLLKQLVPIVAWLCLLTLYYAFVTTAGTFHLLGWHTDYYDLLAEAFGEGQLYLTIAPKARLLSKADPFDYRWVDYWLWDASLYKGHYYIYWGPVPALCLWLFKTVTRYADKVFDQWLVLVFMLGRLYAGTALLVSYARTRGAEVPSWALQLAVIVLAVASPTPYFMARPVIYEASIASAQCFVFCGLFAAYYGLLHTALRERCFVLAGTCFALALGSRGSWLVASPLLVLVTALAAHRPAGYPLRPLLRSLLALGLPIVCGLLIYGLYNWLRFDSVREFGLKYQLTSRPFGNRNRYLLPNIVSYLTSDIAWSCKFPFATLPEGRELTPLIRWPDDYDIGDWDKGERAGGILIGTSICWLWCVWLWRAARSGGRALLRLSLPLPPLRMTSNRELWLVAVSVALVLALAPASRMWMANMRFLEDASGGIVLGGIAGGFWLLDRARASRHAALRVLGPSVYAALCICSIGVGLCLGFSGHMDNFRLENPDLIESLVKHASWCARTHDTE